MRKKTVKSIYFHLIKLTLILVPIIFLLISFFVPTNNDVVVSPVYKYQTNSVSTSDDLVVGNIYHFSLSRNSYRPDGAPASSLHYISCSQVFNETFSSRGNADSTSASNYNNYSSPCIRFRFDTLNNCFWIFYAFANQTSNGSYVYQVQPYGFECDFVYGQKSIAPGIDLSYCISASDFNVLDSFETGTVRDDLNNFFTSFRNFSINSWYYDFISLLGFSIDYSSIFGVICSMPLWILWVNIIELLLDCLMFIPRLAHKWLGGLTGGDKDD